MVRTMATRCPAMRARQASRALSRLYDDALRPLGIQSSQLSVLVAVAMHGEAGAAIGQLARVLVMERTTLTRNLRPLQRAKWLHIEPSADDPRARVVRLTTAGRRMLQRAYPLWEEVTESIGNAVGDRGMDLLRANLGALVEHSNRLKESASKSKRRRATTQR